ncbi:MAG: hypothetical protein M3258_07815 [Thermoproteota archaeon]|nr:hypothetical protein [Thermoproteota archaeon]
MQFTTKPKKQWARAAVAAAVFSAVGLLIVVAMLGPTEHTANAQKFFLALVLQYVDKDSQMNIYRRNMSSEDMTRLRVQNEDLLKPDYVQAVLNLPGSAGVTFKSSSAVIENAKRVKDLGFKFVELNLEPGLSPYSDNNDVVGAMKNASQAAHGEGLKFRAIPSNSYTTYYGPQIAPYADYYHIQAQSLQADGVKAYSDYVHTTISKLKQANPNLKITVQVSAQQGTAPGLTLLETMERCVDSVMDVADGASVWYGNPDLSTLQSFVQWYYDKYH